MGWIDTSAIHTIWTAHDIPIADTSPNEITLIPQVRKGKLMKEFMHMNTHSSNIRITNTSCCRCH